jgi:hypothetical protein
VGLGDFWGLIDLKIVFFLRFCCFEWSCVVGEVKDDGGKQLNNRKRKRL